MTHTPAAHRLLTKKARQERAWRRAMYRMPMRWVLPAGPPMSADQMAEMMRHAPLMVIPEEPTYGYGPIAMTGVTAEEWAEHMRKVGQAYGASLSDRAETLRLSAKRREARKNEHEEGA